MTSSDPSSGPHDPRYGGYTPASSSGWPSPGSDENRYGSDPYGAGGYGSSASGPYPAQSGYPGGQPGQYPGAQPSYGVQPYGTPQFAAQQYGGPPAPGDNTLAVIALVLGIVGIVSCGFGFPLSIAAVVCGHIGLKQIERTGEGGKGMAVAGLVLGYLVTILAALYILVYVGIFATAFGLS